MLCFRDHVRRLLATRCSFGGVPVICHHSPKAPGSSLRPCLPTRHLSFATSTCRCSLLCLRRNSPSAHHARSLLQAERSSRVNHTVFSTHPCVFWLSSRPHLLRSRRPSRAIDPARPALMTLSRPASRVATSGCRTVSLPRRGKRPIGSGWPLCVACRAGEDCDAGNPLWRCRRPEIASDDGDGGR